MILINNKWFLFKHIGAELQLKLYIFSQNNMFNLKWIYETFLWKSKDLWIKTLVAYTFYFFESFSFRIIICNNKLSELLKNM